MNIKRSVKKFLNIVFIASPYIVISFATSIYVSWNYICARSNLVHKLDKESPNYEFKDNNIRRMSDESLKDFVVEDIHEMHTIDRNSEDGIVADHRIKHNSSDSPIKNKSKGDIRNKVTSKTQQRSIQQALRASRATNLFIKGKDSERSIFASDLQPLDNIIEEEEKDIFEDDTAFDTLDEYFTCQETFDSDTNIDKNCRRKQRKTKSHLNRKSTKHSRVNTDSDTENL
ncbi:hypothetical protein EDEG_02038 [Edhazardia aedis USNM 41457]|uniref:Uncharacterized protein n=1 Tax=Edhazardia aedis (strain USNM 41457) TaxID=1003232 RepID=J9D789_EDHAE|nr:hypothetical protein EDEG_02038 [Edhazardia aedis USNM 41457]|eukprot:EJW03641.1 hypothetical protein EDEG_02038 [Edhazardia aedis USNM 41457]